MKDQLKSYIDLLFAGTPNAADIKQEILQNTLDKYDDMIAQGRSPQSAYQLAICGIGDINEILGFESINTTTPQPQEKAKPATACKPVWKKVLSAVAICLYIMCPIPLFVLQNETGLCGLLTFVAVATALMVICGGKSKSDGSCEQPSTSPKEELRKAVKTIIWILGLCVYFALSIALQAWHITWLLFPITASVEGLALACMDLKEAKSHES